MGKRYVQHDDMCGCDRCALQWEHENPGPVFDVIEDPNVCNDCGWDLEDCRCWDDPGDDYDDFDDEDGYFDCGLMPDGQCTKAGSEECDWMCGALDCPAREAQPNTGRRDRSERTGPGRDQETALNHQEGEP